MQYIERAEQLLPNQFFQSSDQYKIAYIKYPKGRARFKATRAINNRPAYLVLRKTTIANPSEKRPILLCYDYNFLDDALALKTVNLVKNLALRGYEIFVLNKSGELEKIDREKMERGRYLVSLLEDMQFQKFTQGADPLYIEKQLKSAGIVNPQHWHLLDHYAISRILYIAENDDLADEDLLTSFPHALEVISSNVGVWPPPNVRTEKVERLCISAELTMNLADFEKIIAPFKNLRKIELNIRKFPQTEVLKRITYLQLIYNDEITTWPTLPDSLEGLEVSSCPSLSKIPNMKTLEKLKKLKLTDLEKITDLPTLPDSIVELTLGNYEIFLELPDFKRLTSLKKLELYSLLKITTLPTLPDSIVELTLQYCNSLLELPDFKRLTSLKKLELYSLPKITTLPTLPDSITKLILYCSKLKKLPDLDYLNSLTTLHLSGCNHIPKLPDCIEELNLSACDQLQALPDLTKYKKLRKITYPRHLLAQHFGQGNSASTEPQSTFNLQKPQLGLEGDTYTDPQTRVKINYAIYRVINGKPVALHPAEYRQTVLDQLVWDSAKKTVCMTASDSPLEFFDESVSPQEVTGFSQEAVSKLQSDQYFVQFPITRSKEWIDLPMLSANEDITHIHRPKDSKLRYNKSLKHYQIYWPPGEHSFAHAELQYVLKKKSVAEEKLLNNTALELPEEIVARLKRLFTESPPQNAAPCFKKLHEQIATLLKEDNPEKRWSFSQKELPEYFDSFTIAHFNSDQYPGEARYISALLQAKGNCQFRALLHVMLCRLLGIPARVNIYPGVHSFGESHNGACWHTNNTLGGAPVVIDNEYQPIHYQTTSLDSSAERKESKQALHDDYSQYFSPLHESARQKFSNQSELLTHVLQQKNILIPLKNSYAARNLYVALQRQLAQNNPNKQIFFLQAPNEFSEQWQMGQIQPDGSIVPVTGPLCQSAKQGNAIWVIDWGERFTPTDVAANMSINDEDPRSFQKMPVHPDLQVINLMTAPLSNRDRFYSRTRLFPWPNNIDFPAPYSIKPPKEESVEDEKGVKLRVDFFNDPETWEEILCHTAQSRDGSFTHLEGMIVKAIKENKRELVLIDAPWDDPEFQVFMLRLQTTRRFTSNGITVDLPPNFTLRWADAPPLPTPPMQLKPLQAEDWQPDHQARDIFYLNASNFQELYQQSLMQRDYLNTIGGWLQQTVGLPKQIVLTGPLSPSQMRRLYILLAAQKKPIEWVNLTQSKKTAKAADLKQVREKSLGNLIETETDTYFVARQLCPKDGLLISIHAHTEDDDLLEEVRPASTQITPEDSKEAYKNISRVSRIEQAVAKALKAGKTVVLHGQLSAELYQALEPLFDPEPHLKLSNAITAKPVPGKLVVVSTPLNFRPILAEHCGSYIRLPSDLWAEYAVELQRACRHDSKRCQRYLEYLAKIQQFYALAEKINGTQTNAQPLLRLTYQRLWHFVHALDAKPAHDNPIKILFHNDYDHSSESYAHLNVIAKVLFKQNSVEEHKPVAGVRQYKLVKYPDDKHCFWRRLNCLNTAALTNFMKLPEEKARDVFEKMAAEPAHANLELSNWLKTTSLEPIERNKDPQKKILAEMNHYLAQGQIVTLKGETGTGKTYGALQYASQPGRRAFLGKANLSKWLNSQPKPGEESVLILNEPNMDEPGTWDFLMPLAHAQAGQEEVELCCQGVRYTVSTRLKVICTINPEHQNTSALSSAEEYYPNRFRHPLLQDNPQIYVTSWTRDSLKRRILNPLLAKVFQPEQLPSGENSDTPSAKDTALERLLTALQVVCHLSALSPYSFIQLDTKPKANAPVVNRHISLRDAQQLLLRWHYHVQHQNKPINEKAYLQAAYEACLLEWEEYFDTTEKREAFKAAMVTLFQPQVTDVLQFESNKRAQPLLEKIAQSSPTFYQGTLQKRGLLSAYEDMQMQANYGHLVDPVDQTAIVKSGLLTEADSGIGKTTQMIALFKGLGCEPLSIDAFVQSTKKDLSRCFIRILPDIDATQLIDILDKAVKTGCKVILEELDLHLALQKNNHKALDEEALESALNELATGKTVKGEVPEIRGFFLSVNQNGCFHAGSAILSKALQNRLHTRRPVCTQADLQEAAFNVVKNKETAQAIVQDFLKMQKRYPDAVNVRNFFQGLRQIEKDFRKTHRYSEADLLVKMRLGTTQPNSRQLSHSVTSSQNSSMFSNGLT